MPDALEHGKEWARDTAEAVVRELGMDGKIEWNCADDQAFTLVLVSQDCAKSVLKIDRTRLRRSAFDFTVQHSLGSEIHAAVRELHIL